MTLIMVIYSINVRRLVSNTSFSPLFFLYCYNEHQSAHELSSNAHSVCIYLKDIMFIQLFHKGHCPFLAYFCTNRRHCVTLVFAHWHYPRCHLPVSSTNYWRVQSHDDGNSLRFILSGDTRRSLSLLITQPELQLPNHGCHYSDQSEDWWAKGRNTT